MTVRCQLSLEEYARANMSNREKIRINRRKSRVRQRAEQGCDGPTKVATTNLRKLWVFHRGTEPEMETTSALDGTESEFHFSDQERKEISEKSYRVQS